jgi:hypothetical protein
MGFVRAAEAAVLAKLEPLGRLLFIFLCVVVAAFALVAGQNYHDTIFFFCHSLTTNMK